MIDDARELAFLALAAALGRRGGDRRLLTQSDREAAALERLLRPFLPLPLDGLEKALTALAEAVLPEDAHASDRHGLSERRLAVALGELFRVGAGRDGRNGKGAELEPMRGDNLLEQLHALLEFGELAVHKFRSSKEWTTGGYEGRGAGGKAGPAAARAGAAP